MKIVKLFWLLPLAFVPPTLWAEDEEEGDDVFEMDLGAILDIEVVSASKSAESIFDAPLSISAVTRQEIVNSGATSMPDALRLVPGMIVREFTNGQFDVHIRGLDGVPPNTQLSFNTNQISLVMIDNRPVYNYYAGGTFWETLPIGLDDIERIEVVRGPSAAMYGPNAASGVIHFITRNPVKEGLSAHVNVVNGSHGTLVANASFGTKTDTMTLRGSLNVSQRERNMSDYFEIASQSYKPGGGDFVSVFGRPQGADFDTRYPDQDLAADRTSLSFFTEFKPSEDSSLEVDIGAEDSEVQKVFVDAGIAPFATSRSETQYLNTVYKNAGFTGQLAYLTGEQETLSVPDAVTGINDQFYELSTIDFTAEYDFKFMDDKLEFRPGVGYRVAEYEARFIGGSQEIEALAVMSRFDYKPTDQWRLIAAVRADQYETPDTTDVSYQLIANYKPAEDMIYRFVVGSASKAPFMLDTYYTAEQAIGGPLFSRQFGDDDLDLLQYDFVELGMRMKLAGNMELDLELWQSGTENYSDIYTSYVGPEFDGTGAPTGRIVIDSTYNNLDVTAEQIGISGNLRVAFSEQLIGKFFLTLQETSVENHIPSLSALETADGLNAINPFLPDPLPPFLIAAIVAEYEAAKEPVNIDDYAPTPEWFGGFALDYKVSDQLKLHLDSYFFDQHQINRTIQPGGGAFQRGGLEPNNSDFDVDTKFIFNTKVSYDINENFNVYLTGRNVANDESVEYYGTDLIGDMWLVGFRYTH